jgi:hypothetical protein
MRPQDVRHALRVRTVAPQKTSYLKMGYGILDLGAAASIPWLHRSAALALRSYHQPDGSFEVDLSAAENIVSAEGRWTCGNAPAAKGSIFPKGRARLVAPPRPQAEGCAFEVQADLDHIGVSKISLQF